MCIKILRFFKKHTYPGQIRGKSEASQRQVRGNSWLFYEFCREIYSVRRVRRYSAELSSSFASRVFSPAPPLIVPFGGILAAGLKECFFNF